MSKIEASKVLNQLKAIQEVNEDPSSFCLSAEEHRAIENSLTSIEEGKVKSHNSVMSSVKATFFGRYFKRSSIFLEAKQ